MTFTGIMLSFVVALLSAIVYMLHMLLSEVERLNRRASDDKTEFSSKIRTKSQKIRANRLTDASKQWLQARGAADKGVR